MSVSQTTRHHRVAARMGLGAALALALLAGCSTPTPDLNTPESVMKLYAEAHEDMMSGSYERAAKSLERVEGRAAGTLLAQQASLDLAYSRWKSGDRAQALVGLDRFIKLNPSSPAIDYAIYLRG